MQRFRLLIPILCILYPLQAKHIALSVVTQHPSLERIQAGIEDTVKRYDPAIRITVDIAHGSSATAVQIANKLVSRKPDVLVGIGTLSAQTLHAASKGKIPLVFSAVTDPYAAQLVLKPDQPQQPVTGTVDFPPLKHQLRSIKAQFPSVKTIGILYNAGEINAVTQVKRFTQEAHKLGYKVIEGTVLNTAYVLEVAHKVAAEADLIYIPNDNTVVSSIEAVVKASKAYAKPVFASDPESLARGVTAAVAHDQYSIGVKTGELIVRILKGEKAQDIPFVAEFEVTQGINAACKP